MGVLVADSKTFSNGLSLTNWVASIKGRFRGVEKTLIYDEQNNATAVYRVFYTVFYYASQTAYAGVCDPISQDSHQLDLTEAQASGDIFAAIYNDIKGNYSNTTDV